MNRRIFLNQSTKTSVLLGGALSITFPKQPRYDGEFLDLARVIRDEKSVEYTPKDDLAVQETILLASILPIA